MKRNLSAVLSALAVVVMFLVSCTQKAEYANVIPSDASVVVSLDLNAIVEKSGVTGNEEAKSKLAEALKSGLNAEALEYAEKIMKDPSESGISVKDKVYFFTLGEGDRQGLVARVTDLDKVKETFKLLQNEGLCGETVETGKNGYWLALISEKDYCCFNENTFFLLIGKNEMDADNTHAELERMIALTPEQSITAGKAFKAMTEKKGDITALVTMDIVPGYYAAMMKESLPEGVTLKNFNVIASLNFEKGKLVVNVENYSDSEAVKKLNAQYAEITAKMGSDFLDYFPASSLMYMGVNLNGEKLTKLLAENEGYQQALKNMQSGGIDFNKILASIDGDVVYGISNISMQGMPTLAVYAKVSNDEIVKEINTTTRGMAKAKGENSYELNMGMGMTMYYGIKEGVFYFTMGENAFENIGKKVDNPMSEAKWASVAKNSYAFGVVNIKDALSIPVVNMMMGGAGKEAAMTRMVLSKLDYIQYAVINTQELQMDIVMTDQSENALKQFVALGKQF